jgi:hypothetical protein
LTEKRKVTLTKRHRNWLLWAGFLLTLVAFASYVFVFVNFPVTRDFPWLNLLLFVGAAVLLIVGLRRAYKQPELYRGKIAGPVLTVFSALIFGLFVFQIFVLARELPVSAAAPHVGAKAPDFTLQDTGGKPVSLSDLLSAPIGGRQPKGALLVFYRGYW